jgi:hypothetical protein
LIPYGSESVSAKISAADPHYFDVDPDPTFHFDADPVLIFHFDADTDKDPAFLYEYGS